MELIIALAICVPFIPLMRYLAKVDESLESGITIARIRKDKIQ